MNSNNNNENVLSTFSNLTLIEENYENTKKTENEIIQKNVYNSFLESYSENALITAPTQVGKTNATREFIEACFEENVPVIVSTDNKTDQNEQLRDRVEAGLCGADVTMMNVTDRTFTDDLKKCILDQNYRFVIFCLDNASQIEKLIMNISSMVIRHINETSMLKKIALIHDEADQITKDTDITSVSCDQAKSHQKWLEFVDLVNNNIRFMRLKRVFVTATPENVVMMYNIQNADVIKLKIPTTYVGYKDIDYIQLEDDIHVKRILKSEVERIKAAGTYEAILYCIERKITDGHQKVLKSVCSVLNCIVNTYNGNGITAHLKTVRMSNQFEAVLKKEAPGLKYKRNDKMFTIKNMPIRRFYSICKLLGENCVVTIGKDLISRGISYVSEDQDEPLTATTMIYKPGTAMHSVGLAQTIGRVTGCAMPNLKRRVYAPEDVIKTYKAYNENQEKYLERMGRESEEEGEEGKLTRDTIAEMVFIRLKRSIDRKKLKLKMKTQSVKGHDNTVFSEARMKQLIDMWWGADTIIGKVLKYVYEHKEGVEEQVLKQYIIQTGSKNHLQIFHHLTRHDKDYCQVFYKDNAEQLIKLKPEAIDYILSRY